MYMIADVESNMDIAAIILLTALLSILAWEYLKSKFPIWKMQYDIQNDDHFEHHDNMKFTVVRDDVARTYSSLVEMPFVDRLILQEEERVMNLARNKSAYEKFQDSPFFPFFKQPQSDKTELN